ncbi:MAG: hypothetical protein ACJ73S_14340 [Mycobacteriales bacterium]|jgi:hypothetical protein
MTGYQPMTLAALAHHLTTTGDQETRWRLVWEFLEEYRWEPPTTRLALLDDEPPPTGDERWDVLLAALAEHLAARADTAAPAWAEGRRLRRFWFPDDLPSARVEALVHAPAAFRSRGIFLSPRDLEAA